MCPKHSLPILALLSAAILSHVTAYTKPNILFILADDAGYADFERNNPHMVTPQLTRLAEMGIYMENSYVLQSCVPSRAALLTGRYPHNFGLQVNTIMGNRLAWLSETERLLPQVLKDFGYSTHMVGKWHQGFCDWDLTPTGRGFDTFYGMLMGAAGHFNHSAYSTSDPKNNTFDFWDNRAIDWSAYGQYSTDLFTARARQIIQGAPTDTPWFLFLSYQAAHGPFEVPEHYVNTYCSHVTESRNRQIHCAMMAAMDEGIGQIIDDIQAKGIMDDTLILFMSDNGGPVKEVDDFSANFPLRSGKQSYWEGGTKSFTIYKGPETGIRVRNITYSGLFHAVDVLPTLAKAAGRGFYSKPSHLDGFDLFWNLQKGTASYREWMLYGVNDDRNTRAIRKGKWKLTKGPPGNQNGWYPSVYQQQQGATYEHIASGEIPEWKWHMFDLEADPYERNNIYNAMKQNNDTLALIEEMKKKMRAYWIEMVPYQLAEKSTLATQLRIQAGHWTPGWCNVTVVS